MLKVKFTVAIQKEENWYVAKCIENSVASQGKTIEEALDNLREALELYYENEKPEIEEKPLFITTLEVAI
ncbi:type II toxin-antitoxin system HicB family antitoxin [Caldanaerobius polysaccharolyticus]|nr:type II toxin-antitoxin system HicB family antitoxin [Caldanaerobius polysaccharolyticus]